MIMIRLFISVTGLDHHLPPVEFPAILACAGLEQAIIPLAPLNQRIVFDSEWTSTRASLLHRCSVCVSPVLLCCCCFHSPGCCHIHTCILSSTTHRHVRASVASTHTYTHTHARIHSSASWKQSAVMDKKGPQSRGRSDQQRHDSDHSQTRSLSPCCEKHVCHVALWGFMCSPPHRSKYNYSASQWSPFIFSSATWSPGCDVNMRERSYHRISESERGSPGSSFCWRANAFTPTQIDSPWQKSLCCLFWAAGQDGKIWTLLLPGREVGLCCPSQSVFYHPPLHGHSGIQRCAEAKESLRRSGALMQMLSPHRS